MPQPYRSIVVPASVEQVWTIVREFDGLPSWHPVIATSTLDSGSDGQVGSVRRLTTPDGGVITERLLALDDENHRLTYAIIECPFATRRYISTIHLSPVTESGDTFAEWFAEYDADAADETELDALFGDGVFGGGLAALRDHFAVG